MGFRERPDREVPEGAARHDHVSRGRADRTDKSTHVVGAVDHHALGSELFEIRRGERRSRVVDLQIKGGLIIDEDEKKIRALFSGGGRSERSEEKGREQDGEFHQVRS